MIDLIVKLLVAAIVLYAYCYLLVSACLSPRIEARGYVTAGQRTVSWGVSLNRGLRLAGCYLEVR